MIEVICINAPLNADNTIVVGKKYWVDEDSIMDLAIGEPLVPVYNSSACDKDSNIGMARTSNFSVTDVERVTGKYRDLVIEYNKLIDSLRNLREVLKSGTKPNEVYFSLDDVGIEASIEFTDKIASNLAYGLLNKICNLGIKLSGLNEMLAPKDIPDLHITQEGGCQTE